MQHSIPIQPVQLTLKRRHAPHLMRLYRRITEIKCTTMPPISPLSFLSEQMLGFWSFDNTIRSSDDTNLFSVASCFNSFIGEALGARSGSLQNDELCFAVRNPVYTKSTTSSRSSFGSCAEFRSQHVFRVGGGQRRTYQTLISDLATLDPASVFRTPYPEYYRGITRDIATWPNEGHGNSHWQPWCNVIILVSSCR